MRKEDVCRAVCKKHHSGMIIHPNAVMLLQVLFCLKTFIIMVTPSDREYYLKSRGVIIDDTREQGLAGGFSDELFLPYEFTLALRNERGCPDRTAEDIAVALLAPSQCQIDSFASGP